LEELAEENPDRPLPAALLLQPEIPEHLECVIEAFQMLSRCRPIALGMQAMLLPIPVSEAFVMADAIGWDRLEFLRVIEPADALYVDEMNRRKAT
jgi:hypothetical protein